LSDDSDDADSDVNMNQDTSSDDESLTNESDSSNDRIPVIKRSKASASTSAGTSLFFQFFY